MPPATCMLDHVPPPLPQDRLGDNLESEQTHLFYALMASGISVSALLPEIPPGCWCKGLVRWESRLLNSGYKSPCLSWRPKGPVGPSFSLPKPSSDTWYQMCPAQSKEGHASSLFEQPSLPGLLIPWSVSQRGSPTACDRPPVDGLPWPTPGTSKPQVADTRPTGGIWPSTLFYLAWHLVSTWQR